MFFTTEQEAIGGAAKTDRKVAKHIRNLTDFRGNAALYQMTPPHDGRERWPSLKRQDRKGRASACGVCSAALAPAET